MLPAHTQLVCDISTDCAPDRSVVVASPLTPHVTLVHDQVDDLAAVIDAAIIANGLRGERIGPGAIKVFGS